MSAFRDELNRRLQAWREENQSLACPRNVRLGIETDLRAQLGPPKTGLAALSPERRAEISAKGGKSAHAKGKAYKFTPDKAKAAGKLGGTAAHAKGVAHRFTSDEAREAGRRGGAIKSSSDPDSPEAPEDLAKPTVL